MSRFRTIIMYFVLAVITVILLAGVGSMQTRMDRQVAEYHLRFTGQVENAPPMVAFTTVALGSFRGLVADLLWLRAGALQDEGNYFEMVQLARWITDLQPTFSGATAYLAWNMAYNISVTCSSFEDRWRWVNEGIKLLRDQAMVYNPEDPILYKELAWFYHHKMGNILDDANLYYKNQMAILMTGVLGENPDWVGMAAAPVGEKAFMKAYPPTHPLWKAMEKCGLKDYAALYDAFITPYPAELPQKLTAALDDPAENKKLSDYFRAEYLRKRLKIDAKVVRELNVQYGEFDWRVPESHAVYWATQGIRHTLKGENLDCARIITQALQDCFRSGRILVFDAEKAEDIQLMPNLALVGAAYNAYMDTQKHYDKDRDYSTFRSARINFLKPAVMDLYTYGKTAEAAKYFKLLIKEDGPQKGGTLEKFVQIQFADRIKNGTVRTISGAVNGLFFRSIVCLIGGDQEAAVAHERLARFVYNYYENDMGGTARTKLPPYKEMKAQIVTRLLEIWDKSNPRYAALLRAKIGEEEAAAAEQKKNAAGDTGKK